MSKNHLLEQVLKIPENVKNSFLL